MVEWWLALLVVGLLPWLAGVSLRECLAPLWRLRFFFIILFLLHGLFVPGTALLPFSEWPSREGLVVGGQQALRLGVMASLAWVLMKVSSPEALVTGLCGLLGWSGRLGVPVRRWATLLSWTLECVGRLLVLAAAIRDRVVREGGEDRGWSGTMTLLGRRASFLLTDMMDDMADQEQRLLDRGIVAGLPEPLSVPSSLGWRDGLLVLFPFLLLTATVLNSFF